MTDQPIPLAAETQQSTGVGIWRRLVSRRHVHLSPATWLALGLQVVFITIMLITGRNAHIRWLSPAHKVLFVAVNLVSTVAYFQIIGLLLRRWQMALRLANITSIWALSFMFCWHYYTARPLSFMIVASNIHELFHMASLKALVDSSSPLVFVGMGLLTIALTLLAFRTRAFAHWPQPIHARSTLFVTVIVFGAIFATPAAFYHDLTHFGRTAITFFVDPVDCPDDYAYVRLADDIPQHRRRPPRRPHVFIIMIESFNANFLDDRTEDGREVTPVFNSLRSRGLAVDKFYGNAIQTIRGQETLLGGIPASYRTKISYMRRMPRLHGLPAAMRQAGYRTYFFQAHTSLQFDNTDRFMAHLGFQNILSLSTPDHLTPEDQPYMWNYWGLQDDRFYTKAFEHLDREASADQQADQAPCFVVLATITTHMKWLDIPAHLRVPYPDATDSDTFKNFANAIHLADRCLETFFDELAGRPWLNDSLVIITGDHGYPRGQHEDNFQNEVGYFDDNFRTPLLMIWPGQIEPKRITDRAYSHLDIAPTLLDLLGIYVDHHFVGESIFSPPAEQHVIPLAQPYDGGPWLAALRYPMKYIVNRMTGTEVLINLENDPQEAHNLVSQYSGTALLRDLRRHVHQLEVNQRRIEYDRIWPN